MFKVCIAAFAMLFVVMFIALYTCTGMMVMHGAETGNKGIILLGLLAWVFVSVCLGALIYLIIKE